MILKFQHKHKKIGYKKNKNNVQQQHKLQPLSYST